MATATTSRYTGNPSSPHWASRGSAPSHHSHRSEPIMIPASSSRTSTRSSGAVGSSPRYITTSRRGSNIIHPASPSTYTSEDGLKSPKVYSTSSSSTAKYESKRNSITYSTSPQHSSSSSSFSSSSKSPSSSYNDRRHSSPASSPKSSRRRSVSFASAPVLIPQSPGRERFEKKYNVECLESPRSLVDALNGAVVVQNSSSSSSSTSGRSRRGSLISSSGSPPTRAQDLPLRDGITTLPRNLVGREAVDELGYGQHCEIDSYNITIFKALSKEQIDCLIALTEQLRRKESKRNSRQTVVVLEAANNKGEKHHFSPRRSSVCQTPHRGGCTAACFPIEQDCSCCR